MVVKGNFHVISPGFPECFPLPSGKRTHRGSFVVGMRLAFRCVYIGIVTPPHSPPRAVPARPHAPESARLRRGSSLFLPLRNLRLISHQSTATPPSDSPPQGVCGGITMSIPSKTPANACTCLAEASRGQRKSLQSLWSENLCLGLWSGTTRQRSRVFHCLLSASLVQWCC